MQRRKMVEEMLADVDHLSPAVRERWAEYGTHPGVFQDFADRLLEQPGKRRAAVDKIAPRSSLERFFVSVDGKADALTEETEKLADELAEGER